MSLLENDYIKLIQYFQERADSAKHSMLTIVPWVITFTSGILAFGIKEGAIAVKPWLTVGYGSLALIGCIIAEILNCHFGTHVHSNWKRSKYVKDIVRSSQLEDDMSLQKYLDILKIKSVGEYPEESNAIRNFIIVPLILASITVLLIGLVQVGQIGPKITLG